jgi:hypothetical protein
MSATTGPLIAPPEALHGLGRRPARAGTRARHWLAAETAETLTLEPERPRGPGTVAADPVEGSFETSLGLWAGRLRRRRAIVVLRRYLIAVLALTLAVELVTLAAGGDRLAWWLLAPLALGLASCARALRSDVGLRRTAQILDRRLGLHDLTVTALELSRAQPGPGPESEPRPAPGSLAALVLEEGRTATAASLAALRARARDGHREAAWLAGAAALLAAVILIAGSGSGATGVHGTHAGASTAAGRALAQRQAAAVAAARRAALARALGTGLPNQAPPPLAVQTGRSGSGSRSAYSPYGHGGSSLSAKQLASQGIASAPSTKASLGALSLGGSGTSTGAGAGRSPAASGGASGRTAIGGGTAKQGPGSSTGAAGLAAATSHSAAALGAGATRESGSGAGSGGSSPRGGGAAGTARGSTALVAGLIPALGTSGSGLPLQAGYAPSSSTSQSGKEGVSQTPNGGGGAGRSKQSTSGGESTRAGELPVIPPSLNAASTVDQGVLSSYFGSANQLTAGSW